MAQSQEILSALADAPLSTVELSERLGIGKSGEFKKLLKHLVVEQTIEYTLPDKPNSRLQKYRLTAKGREKLEALKETTKNQKSPGSAGEAICYD